MQTQTQRTKVTVEDRRHVLLHARSRKPADVAKTGHEDFIRRELKMRMGWPQRDPAPEAVKVAAKELAAQLIARDKAAADEKAARDAAVAQGIADNV